MSDTATDTRGKVQTIAIVTVIFGLVNLLVKPVVRFVTFPIRILTFGLFSLVINGAMLFLMSDLINYGELGVEINFKADAVPPIEEDFEPAVINFPSGTTWAFQGALKEYAPEAPIDDRMTATATIKVSGKITITPAA